MLTDLFSESAGHTREDFLKVWGPLLEYLNNGADGVIVPPYRLEAFLDVGEKTLDVSMEIKLSRAHAIAGQQEPYWETLRFRHYNNINVAGMLPFGDTYRFLFGRSKTMTSSPSGPMPLYFELRADRPEVRQDLQDWALEGIREDQKAGRRPVLRVIPGGRCQGPDI